MYEDNKCLEGFGTGANTAKMRSIREESADSGASTMTRGRDEPQKSTMVVFHFTINHCVTIIDHYQNENNFIKNGAIKFHTVCDSTC